MIDFIFRVITDDVNPSGNGWTVYRARDTIPNFAARRKTIKKKKKKPPTVL